MAVSAGLALVFLVAAAVIGWRVWREAKARPFAASLAELQRDAEAAEAARVRAFLDGLVRRRTALVERSTAQRGDSRRRGGGACRVRPPPRLLLGVGLAITLLTSSPKLRGWLVRGWAVYVLVRRLLGR